MHRRTLVIEGLSSSRNRDRNFVSSFPSRLVQLVPALNSHSRQTRHVDVFRISGLARIAYDSL